MSYIKEGQYYYKEGDDSKTPYYKCTCTQNGKLKVVYKAKKQKRTNKKKNILQKLSNRKFDDEIFDKINEILIANQTIQNDSNNPN